MGLKIILLKLAPDFPGVNELITINRGNWKLKCPLTYMLRSVPCNGFLSPRPAVMKYPLLPLTTCKYMYDVV